MSTASATRKAGPGRPSSGARERIIDGCLEVLKDDGYAGLTLAKVAVAAGESKALIGYHFGAKADLVVAAARELGDSITSQIRLGLDGTGTIEEIVDGALAGIWGIVDRDERLPRAYFDLNAVSVVDPEIRDVMQEVKRGFREVLHELLIATANPLPASAIPSFSILLIAGIEGLMLERIERGESDELAEARDLFVRAMTGIAAKSR